MNLTALIAATGYLAVLVVIAFLVIFGVPFALSLWAQP